MPHRGGQQRHPAPPDGGSDLATQVATTRRSVACVEFAESTPRLLMLSLSAAEFRPHFHSRFTLALVRAGHPCMQIGGKPVRGRPGDIYVVHPFQVHSGGSITGFEYDTLHPSDEFTAAAAQLPGREAKRPLFPDLKLLPRSDRSRSLFEAVDRLRSREGPNPSAWNAAVEQAVMDVFAAQTPRIKPLDLSHKYQAAVSGACERLLAQSAQPISVAALAAQGHLSFFHFIRLFRRVTGVTPGTYLRLARLSRACEFIERGMSLSAAAAESGFADQAHMTRLFKSFYGYTPGCLAQQLRKHV